MSVAVPVNQVGTNNTYNLRVDLSEAEGEVRAEYQEETTAALFGYIEEMARTDADLREDEAQLIRLRQCSTANSRQQQNAELVGRRIRNIGDEFMEQFLRDQRMKSIVDECIEDKDGNPSAQTTYDHFCEVVKLVFECDENGIGKGLNKY